MSKDYFNNPFPGSEWADLFDDYIKGLNSFGTFTSGREQNKIRMWQKAMEFWWEAMQSEVPGFANPTMQRLMEQGKTFYLLGQQFSDLLENLKGTRGTDEYLEQLTRQIDNMKAVMEASQSFGHLSVSGLLDAWQVPGDLWSGLLKNIPGAEKDIIDALKIDDLDTFMDKYLNLPGVGYAREYQEKLQKNVVLLKEFLKATEEYNEGMGRVTTSALDSLRDRIIEMARNEEEITSLRQLYNIWVDCNEEAYAEFVFSQEYSVLYGNFVNAMSAYKKQSNEIRDDMLTSNSLPTRGDLEAMQKQSMNLTKKLNRAIAKNRTDELRIEELENRLSDFMNETGKITGKEPETSSSGGARSTTAKKAKTGKRKTRTKTSGTSKSKAKKKTRAAGKKAGRRKAGVNKGARDDDKIVNIASAKSGSGKSGETSDKNSGKKTIEIKF